MLRFYREPDTKNYTSQHIRPVFQANQFQQGLWLQLIPNKLKIIIVDPGVGCTPKTGEFIRVKQLIYLANMTLLKLQRVTYTFNRNKIIKGLEYCLSLSREGFKSRIFIPSQLAYAEQTYPGIPPHSDLVIDIEVTSISTEPISVGKTEDEDLIAEIIAKASDADEYLKRGQFISAQRCLQSAFASIQSTRSKQIKNHLYYNSKVTTMINNNEKTAEQIKKEKEELVQIFLIFDRIKVKTVEVALINKDYYKVIILTKQSLMESRLQHNSRILAARSRAFVQVGQFQKGIELMQHLSDQHPKESIYKQQLNRALCKAEKFSLQTNHQIEDPVLTLNKPIRTKKRARERQKQKESKYDDNEEEQYQADEEIQKIQPFFSNIGMQLLYEDQKNQ